MARSQYIKPFTELIAHESFLMASNSRPEKWCVDHQGENEQNGEDRNEILNPENWNKGGSGYSNPWDSDNW